MQLIDTCCRRRVLSSRGALLLAGSWLTGSASTRDDASKEEGPARSTSREALASPGRRTYGRLPRAYSSWHGRVGHLHGGGDWRRPRRYSATLSATSESSWPTASWPASATRR